MDPVTIGAVISISANLLGMFGKSSDALGNFLAAVNVQLNQILENQMMMADILVHIQHATDSIYAEVTNVPKNVAAYLSAQDAFVHYELLRANLEKIESARDPLWVPFSEDIKKLPEIAERLHESAKQTPVKAELFGASEAMLHSVLMYEHACKIHRKWDRVSAALVENVLEDIYAVLTRLLMDDGLKYYIEAGNKGTRHWISFYEQVIERDPIGKQLLQIGKNHAMLSPSDGPQFISGKINLMSRIINSRANEVKKTWHGGGRDGPGSQDYIEYDEINMRDITKIPIDVYLDPLGTRLSNIKATFRESAIWEYDKWMIITQHRGNRRDKVVRRDPDAIFSGCEQCDISIPSIKLIMENLGRELQRRNGFIALQATYEYAIQAAEKLHARTEEKISVLKKKR